MELLMLLIVAYFFISINCCAQNQYQILVSLESSFDRITREMKIPCQFNMEYHRKENGRPFFTNKDSTRLEFYFFRISSLPFFYFTQTSSETISYYYNWIIQKMDTLKSIQLAKIGVNKKYGYWVFKI